MSRTLVATKCEGWVGHQLQWTQFNSVDWQNGVGIAEWAAGTGNMPPSNNLGGLTICCFELPVLAAAFLGSLSQTNAGNIYAGLLGGAAALVSSRKRVRRFSRPGKGDLVFFHVAGNDLAHVAISTGGNHGQEIISFGEGNLHTQMTAVNRTTIDAVKTGHYPMATAYWGHPRYW